MVKYACKVTSSRCLSQSFTAVHEDVPKCMPEEHLHLEPVKLDFRGFESRRMQKHIASGLEDLSFGTQKERYTKSCARTFFSDIRYHSAKREALWCISQSNAKASLA